MNEIEARSHACIVDELISEICEKMDINEENNFLDQVLYTAAIRFYIANEGDESVLHLSDVIQSAYQDYKNNFIGSSEPTKERSLYLVKH